MNLYMLMASAMRSLRNHKVRSLLTTLGIIIGIVAIICVMSIGEGAKQRVNKEIEKLGTNFIIVLSASQKRMASRGHPGEAIFTPQDLATIRTEATDVDMVSPGNIAPLKITAENKSWDTNIGGVEENYLDIRQWKLIMGTFLTNQDVKAQSKVAVLGITVANELFGKDKNPIGQTIRIKKIPFKIIGVLEEKGKSPDGRDQDDTVFIPITTLAHRLQGKKLKYFALICQAKSKERIRNAEEQIRSIIRQKHNVNDKQEDNFTIFTQDDISQASDAATKILNILLMVVASISLLVGGIGIMNIMLVTVTERTREIGIRMALGATTSNILTQFLLESITICLAGGSLGALAGVAMSKFVGIALGWSIFISKTSVIVSLFSSMLIGLFFGFYPAHKASMLNPVDALADK
ncbi:MAG: ABC transporter permease [bacterium]